MGYVFVTAPAGYPGRIYRSGQILEHHLVWWRHTGQLVPPGMVLHHKNENKADNVFENLELKPRGTHTKDHCSLGNTKLRCAYCKQQFWRSVRQANTYASQGCNKTYCSRECAGKDRLIGGNIRHGTAVAYRFHKCRCSECRKGNATRARERRARKALR